MLGHIEIIRLLIARGADVNIRNAEGASALDCALMYKQNECAAYLKDLGARSNASESIFIAAQTGNVEAITQHLESGEDVNGKCPLGNTPLGWAVNNGDIKLFDGHRLWKGNLAGKVATAFRASTQTLEMYRNHQDPDKANNPHAWQCLRYSLQIMSAASVFSQTSESQPIIQM